MEVICKIVDSSGQELDMDPRQKRVMPSVGVFKMFGVDLSQVPGLDILAEAKLQYNEVLIKVNPTDTLNDIMDNFEAVIIKIKPVLANAPMHHWHGRKAQYITFEVPKERKEEIKEFLKDNMNRVSPQYTELWFDAEAEHGLSHRIQIVFVDSLSWR